jgi:SAM-dependent methyltransferase
MLESGLYLPLPAAGFVSLAEYIAYSDRMRGELDVQGNAEYRLIEGHATLRHEATCAPCLRRAVLTSQVRSGRLPDWPQEQICDCEDRLDGRSRTLLHAAASLGGLRSWSRLLLFGPSLPVHRRLRAMAGDTVVLPDLPATPRLPEPDGAFHVIVAADCLHRVADLAGILAELRRTAAPGGSLLATVPFRYTAPVTASGRRRHAVSGLAPTELHAIGWDVLPMLLAAGWGHAEVLRIWSREFGYLGAHNYLIRAVA